MLSVEISLVLYSYQCSKAFDSIVFKGNGTLHGRIQVACNNDSSWSMDNGTIHNDYECKRECDTAVFIQTVARF